MLGNLNQRYGHDTCCSEIHPIAADSGAATDLLEYAQADKNFFKINVISDET
jgi:hypothetical protein